MDVACSNCMWFNTDQCDGRLNGYIRVSDCSYYPLLDEVSDEAAELLVEEGRKEYDNAWNSYIRNFYFEPVNNIK